MKDEQDVPCSSFVGSRIALGFSAATGRPRANEAISKQAETAATH
jgi:hypothetical protein